MIAPLGDSPIVPEGFDELSLEATARPRVLLVDDDERNLLAVATVLEDLGEVVVARSGEEALRHLLKGEFAVILLDVYMPGMDGYETAQIIRSRDQTKGIPIVFLSAVNKEAEHLLRGYSMGAVDYVFKPVDPVVLRSKVAVFVDLFAKTKEIERKAEEQRALESKLVQAQKMDAIGKLTGGIAHDFNNLLAAVIGGLGLLEKRASLGEDEAKILGMTKRAAEQGTELVRRLLAFARKQKLEPKAVDIGDLRDVVSDLLTHTLGGLVHIDWKIAPDLPAAFADQAQLELALVNLIINARDAMPDGGTVTVSIESRRTAQEEVTGLAAGDYVRLCVSDTGTGIAPEHLEKVMEPFFTTKDIGKGSGLGLPMVYGFAKQSNGAFRLESAIGRGTSAELFIPRAPSAAKEGKSKTRNNEQQPLLPASPLCILLVDDHPEVRTTTAAMLAELGHSVIEATNGRDALFALENGAASCDLLISDYAMPHISGTEFVRLARQVIPEVPAIIITGYAEADAVRDRPEGVEILLKPFGENALQQALARACSQAAAHPGHGAPACPMSAPDAMS
jgi:CheY-like chemotaxis protein/anti-sigma regulatory factor (Ser/Thr protein kinase)